MVENRQNYQRIMDDVIQSIRESGKKPLLLLHCCCAPCTTSTLERLYADFNIVLHYCNPNIYPKQEYDKRLTELERFISLKYPSEQIKIIASEWNHGTFLDAVKGLEAQPEGGSRCEVCFRLRLNEASRVATQIGADFFTTTLTVSPHKNADILNSVGEEAAKESGARFLNSDFKKLDGYKRSIEISREYGIYRQDYCGCEFSLNNAE